MKIELAQYDGEYIVHILGKPSEDFKETLGQVFEAYQEFLDSENLQVDDEVRVRLYLSDLANQYGELCEFIAENKFEDRNIITIGQAPTSLSKVSLEAYLIRNTANTDLSVKGRVSDNVFKFSHGEYETLFIRNKSNPNLERDEQAKDLLNCLSRDVGFNQGDVEKDLHRTWIYIRDIDMNYQVLADERKKYFDTINMTLYVMYQIMRKYIVFYVQK